MHSKKGNLSLSLVFLPASLPVSCHSQPFPSPTDG